MIIGDFFRLHGAYPSKISRWEDAGEILGHKKGIPFLIPQFY
jgi:hypothetical protein